jgi:hypothetical protein
MPAMTSMTTAVPASVVSRLEFAILEIGGRVGMGVMVMVAMVMTTVVVAMMVTMKDVKEVSMHGCVQ